MIKEKWCKSKSKLMKSVSSVAYFKNNSERKTAIRDIKKRRKIVVYTSLLPLKEKNMRTYKARGFAKVRIRIYILFRNNYPNYFARYYDMSIKRNELNYEWESFSQTKKSVYIKNEVLKLLLWRNKPLYNKLKELAIIDIKQISDRRNGRKNKVVKNK